MHDVSHEVEVRGGFGVLHRRQSPQLRALLVTEVLVGLATDTTVYLSRRGEALKVNKLTLAIRASVSSWHPGRPGRPLFPRGRRPNSRSARSHQPHAGLSEERDCAALTVIYVPLTVLYVPLPVLYVSLTVLYVPLTGGRALREEGVAF